MALLLVKMYEKYMILVEIGAEGGNKSLSLKKVKAWTFDFFGGVGGWVWERVIGIRGLQP